jgi:hypothetical protein
MVLSNVTDAKTEVPIAGIIGPVAKVLLLMDCVNGLLT